MNELRLINILAFLGGIVGETLTIALLSNDFLGAVFLTGGTSSMSAGVYLYFKHSRKRPTFFRAGFIFMFIGAIFDIAFNFFNAKDIIFDIFCFLLAGTLMLCMMEATDKTQVFVAFCAAFLGLIRIMLFVLARDILLPDVVFVTLIIVGIIAKIMRRVIVPHEKVKKLEKSSVTMAVDEAPKISEIEQPQFQSLPIKKKMEIPEEPVTHEVDEKTESEIRFFRRVERCIVCNTQLKGQTFVCPFCETKYCLRCAKALSQREETCWSCKKPISLEQDQK